MTPDKEIVPGPAPSRQARAFKATIVMTRHDGVEPTLRDVQTALIENKMAFAMPAQPDGTIVISLMQPPREGLPDASEAVLGSATRLDKDAPACQEE